MCKSVHYLDGKLVLSIAWGTQMPPVIMHSLSIRSKLYPPRDIRIPNILKSHEPTPFWCGGSLLDYPIHVEVGATGTVGTPI